MDAITRKLRQQTSAALSKKQAAPRAFVGFLGKNDGTVRVSGRDNYVYVRLPDASVVEAFNGVVPAVAGLPVIGEYANRRYKILRARDSFSDPVFCVPDGLTGSMQWPGANTLFVKGEQFLPGLVAAIGGMIVRIYPTDEYPGEDLDLTSHIPATGARWVLIEVNDTAAHVVDGTIVTLDTLNATPKPSKTAGYISKAAIRLYAGQTEILYTATASDIVDKRFDSSSLVSADDIDGTIVPSQFASLTAWVSENLTAQITGATAHFTTGIDFNAVNVFINGLRQNAADVEIDSGGDGLTLSFIPEVGDRLTVDLLVLVSALVLDENNAFVLDDTTGEFVYA